MSANGRPDLIADLVEKKYDLAVDLYRRRAVALAAEAGTRKGVFWEYAAYKVFGTDNIAGLALWLDPLWQFRRDWTSKDSKSVYLQTIAPITRTRYQTFIVPETILSTVRRDVISMGRYGVWNGRTTVQGPWRLVSANHEVSPVVHSYQQRIDGFIKDTTWKSRNPGKRIPKKHQEREKLGLQSQGELEIFKPTFCASPGEFHAGANSNVLTDAFQEVKTTESRHVTWRGSSASVSASDVLSIPGIEKAYAIAAMQKYADDMLANCLPVRRKFNLAYQIGELKDLPQTLIGTLSVFKGIESIIGWREFKIALTSPSWWTQKRQSLLSHYLNRIGGSKVLDGTASSAYLTFKFGYESMYQAIDRYLKVPGKIAKDVNLLIDANGDFQTLSTKKDLGTKEWTAPPAVDFGLPIRWLQNPDAPYKNVGTRTASLRCVVNTGVRFPNIDVPGFREQLYKQKLGWPARPSDIYNLIPWTWMVDWFGSLGSYLRLLEEIHMDKSLINWGVMVYKSTLTGKASREIFDTISSGTVVVSPPYTSTVTEKLRMTQSSEFTAEYELRIGIESLAKVKTTSGHGELTPFQVSILGALISQFT